MTQYISFGYGTLAEHYSDEEVLAKCHDPEFQQWYLDICKDAVKENYVNFKTYPSGKIKYNHYMVPDDPH